MEKLLELKLYIEHSEAEDREPIDYNIRDKITDERYATVWGSDPLNDIQWDCEHPDELAEMEDIDEQGVCPICGATCDWHWVKDVDEGRDCDGNYTAREIQVREVLEWHEADKAGGLIGELLKDSERRF